MASDLFVGGVARISVQIMCSQEEPGSIMRVKLATGSFPEEKSDNCPHQSKIKALIKQLDFKSLIWLAQSTVCSLCVCQ